MTLFIQSVTHPFHPKTLETCLKLTSKVVMLSWGLSFSAASMCRDVWNTSPPPHTPCVFHQPTKHVLKVTHLPPRFSHFHKFSSTITSAPSYWFKRLTHRLVEWTESVNAHTNDTSTWFHYSKELQVMSFFLTDITAILDCSCHTAGTHSRWFLSHLSYYLHFATWLSWLITFMWLRCNYFINTKTTENELPWACSTVSDLLK